MKAYKYVGPPELLKWVSNTSNRLQIRTEADVLNWLLCMHQRANLPEETIATFIIDLHGHLWIADRHSEHVVCANGGPVLSAGEMTFHIKSRRLEVREVTNQSTGFCPEPTSWPSVANALDEIGLAHTNGFTTKFDFRRCHQCGSINVIKEQWFVCSLCDAELSETWNLNV